MARGSAAEVQNQLIIARDLDYITQAEFDAVKVISFEGYKLLCGIIQSVENFRKYY